MLLGFASLKFLCIPKCTWRSHDQSQKIWKLFSNCYELSKSKHTQPLGSHIPPPPTTTTTKLCWLIEPGPVIQLWTHNPISFWNMSFWRPFLRYAPNHPPFIYRCPFRTSHRIRAAYLTLPYLVAPIEHSNRVGPLCWIKKSGQIRHLIHTLYLKVNRLHSCHVMSVIPFIPFTCTHGPCEIGE